MVVPPKELELGPMPLSAITAAWGLTISVTKWSRPLDGIGAASTYPQVSYRWILSNHGLCNFAAGMLAITVNLAYFIYDTICCALELSVSKLFYIHHLLTLIGLAFGYVRQTSGTELVASLMLTVVSNPCFHGRGLLKELKHNDSPISLTNDILFALVFIVARILVGPVVVYLCVVSPTSPFAVKVGAVGIEVVSVLSFYKLARMVTYKLSKPSSRKAASLP